MSRPTWAPAPPPGNLPEGYAYVAEPETSLEWRPAHATTHKRCRAAAGYRATACGMPAVAEFNRRRWSPLWEKYLDNWWAYCGDHMYGRWIDHGVIMCWIVREVKP